MKDIKTKLWNRGLSLAKLSVKSGVKAAGQAIFSKDREDYLLDQFSMLAGELGELKGSLMKAGQMVSMYGEHFLPEKVNDVLKKLQFESPPMEWKTIKQQLIQEWGEEKFNEVELDQTALASASLGQVHRAKFKGQELAIKIQYPGVDDAIDTDLKAIKLFLKLAKVLPQGDRSDLLFQEIKTMLKQETDYQLEAGFTKKMYELLKEDPSFVVPKVIDELSTQKILATLYEPGTPIDSDEVKALDQKRRDYLGLKFFELYMKELFEFKLVQSDPHLGNYRIRINEDGKDQLVLYDFGAMKKVPSQFGIPFRKMVTGAALKNEARILQSGIEMGYVLADDDKDLKQSYIQLCLMIGEPFHGDTKSPFVDPDTLGYDWKASDLPLRVAEEGQKLAKKFKLRVPPKESLFLDRKLGGTFVFLSVLGLKANARPTLDHFLN